MLYNHVHCTLVSCLICVSIAVSPPVCAFVVCSGCVSIAGLTLGIGLLDCNRDAAVSMYVAAIVILGVQSSGSDPNSLDIAPAYSGKMTVCSTIRSSIYT